MVIFHGAMLNNQMVERKPSITNRDLFVTWFGIPYGLGADTSLLIKAMIWTINALNFNGTLWLFNIAMENGPFIDGLPITNGDFPCQC